MQEIRGDDSEQDAELEAESHSCRSFDLLFRDAKSGTTRRSSPGRGAGVILRCTLKPGETDV